MNKPFRLSIPLVILAVIGCNGSTSDTKTAEKPSSTTSGTSGSTTSGSASGSSTGSTPATTTAANPAEIPANLKHDGYVYYGLANTAPMKLEIRDSAQPSATKVGTQTVEYKGMIEGKPTFLIERTGGIEVLGAQEVRLEPDGVYNSSSTVAKVGPKALEIPANLAPGTTFPSHEEVDQSGQSMILDSVFKVERTEKVTTKAGEHEALLITSTGKGKINGQDVTTSTKGWYVKNLGAVKSELTTYFPKGTTETITIEEIK